MSQAQMLANILLAIQTMRQGRLDAAERILERVADDLDQTAYEFPMITDEDLNALLRDL